ncbi:MAG: pyruvate synthase subunit beta [Euryarchaeota archaeon]|nr:pyruvate synthase subunit beta [Euryarchaeota archaeon]
MENRGETRPLDLFSSGHRACAGCGPALTIQAILRATGAKVFVVSATGCMEVVSSQYPQSAWNVPWIHSLFENSAAVASGIEVALKVLGRSDDGKVVVIAGDGGTVDIGMQAISGMFERGHDICYICYDNEAYMNTGNQRSGSTPYDASTTTSPAGAKSFGNDRPKKDMPAIAAAHGIPYVATTSVGYPKDLTTKVQKGISVDGPAYLQIHAPCNIGWGFDSAKTIEIARLAVETGLWAMYEIVDGKLTNVMKVSKSKPVEEYLKQQRRFAHLFKMPGGEAQIKIIQDKASANVDRLRVIAEEESR